MAKISNTTSYPNATPAANDYVIGTDIDDNNATKTFKLQEIANLYAGSGSGTVTSVGLDGGTTGITITSDTANPITTTGTFTLGGTLATANGGTGLTTLGTDGQVLKVNTGATALEFGSPTFSVQNSGGAIVTGIDTLNFNTNVDVITAPGSSTAIINASGGSGGPGTGTQYSIPLWSTTSTLGDSLLSQDSGATKVVLAATKKLEIPNDGTTSATAINFGTANTGINGYGTTGIGLVSGGQSRVEVTTGLLGSQDITLTGLTQSDGGLRFGSSGSTLDTYTEATWSGGPILTFSVGGAATLTASSGSYRCIGDMVFASFTFTFGSGGYGTVDMSLPLSGIAGTGSINFTKMNSSVGNSTVSTPVTGDILTNSASIRLKSFNYDQDSGSHVSGQLFELVETQGQPVFQSGDVVSGTVIYRKA